MVREPSTKKPGRGGINLSDRLRDVAVTKTPTTSDREVIGTLRSDIGSLDDPQLVQALGELRRQGEVELPTGDFAGVDLKPAQILEPINVLTKGPDLPRLNALDFVTDSLFDQLRKTQPDAIPLKPLVPGMKGAAIPVTSLALTRLVALAAVRRSGDRDIVVWDDGRNEILVHSARMKAAITVGQVRIDIPTETNAGRATMRIPFAMGGGKRSSGLVVSTLDRPAGNAAVARIWGDALIALAYGALMDAAGSLVGASGRDVRNQRLVPRAFRAEKGRLIIESQARLDFKEKRP